MSDYMEHLRRLALHDDALLEAIAVEGSSFATHVIDERTEALARVAATVLTMPRTGERVWMPCLHRDAGSGGFTIPTVYCGGKSISARGARAQ